jgi:pimeloyl-ACP methyl ester carboxylesterase
MASDRIQRAVSADGTEIAGHVHGQGPPLVLFHGGPDDGDLAWEVLVPHCRAGAGENCRLTATTTRPRATRWTPRSSSTASAEATAGGGGTPSCAGPEEPR